MRSVRLGKPDAAVEPVTGVSSHSSADEREREDALLSLKILRERIEDIEKELTWLGHNNPPEVAESVDLVEREQFRQALSDIDLIRTELEKPEPNIRAVEQGKSRLLLLATALAKWTGARATKFADATLAVAAPVIVVKVSGLMPLLVNAVETITRTVSH